MSTTNPSTSERRNLVSNIAVVTSVLLSAAIISFISLLSYLAADQRAERSECLRPFTYEVDRQFGQAMLSAMNKDEDGFKKAAGAYEVAINARDTANRSC